MKKVEAIVQPARAEAIIERLLMIGMQPLYISEARGFGRTRGHQLIHKGSPYEVEFVPKLRIEWFGEDEEAELVVRAVEQSASTGELGDGRIFVSEIDGELEL